MGKNENLQFCVIGLGAYGSALAESLSAHGSYVLAIDKDIEKVEAIQQHVSEAVQFDATDPRMLAEHGVFGADVVIVGIGEFFEPVVIICMELLKADVKRIIARAGNNTQETILNRIGISEVIHPEKDEGERMAAQLSHSSVTDFFKLSKDIAIYEIDAPERIEGYTLADLKLRERYNINLLTIKRPKPDHKDKEADTDAVEVLGVLKASTKILAKDRLVTMGRHEDINKFIDTN